MKICIPIETDHELESKIFSHFGKTPFFLIYDSETKKTEAFRNQHPDNHHHHCLPLSDLKQHSINMVVGLGMGRRIVEKLNAGKIQTFRSKGKTVSEVLKDWENGSLIPMTANNSCQGGRHAHK